MEMGILVPARGFPRPLEGLGDPGGGDSGRSASSCFCLGRTLFIETRLEGRERIWGWGAWKAIAYVLLEINSNKQRGNFKSQRLFSK